MNAEDTAVKTFQEVWLWPARPVTSEISASLVPTLAEAVLVAVRTIPKESLQRVAPQEAGVAYQPSMLLALLTYCYASGLYASEDIEQRMCQDADFCRVCADEFPGALMLQRFRRLNRDALIRSLAHVLGSQQEQQGATCATTSLPDQDATERSLLDQARQRIRTAIQFDLND
jgi:hypothetical protein